jgi:hypothetical protein
MEIQSIPPHRHPVLTSALEPMLGVTMPGVAETSKSVINEMTNGTDFELIKLLHAEHANLTQKNLNTSIEKPEN